MAAAEIIHRLEMPEAGRAAWTMATEDPPWWAWMIVAAFMWLAETLVETARIRAQKTGRPDDITAAVLRLEKSG